MNKKKFLIPAVVLLVLCCGLILGPASGAGRGQSGGKSVADLKVYDISVKSEDCRLWVTYQNVGNKTAQGTLRERITVQNVVVEDTMIGFNLPPGQYYGHGVGADPGYKLTGLNKTVTAAIDVDNALPETNKANNTMTKTLSCTFQADLHPGTYPAPQKADLCIPYIKFVVVNEGDDAAGHYVTFNAIVYVKNVGQGGAGPFDVLLEHQLDGQGPYLACQTCKIHVPGLIAGQGLELQPRQYTKRGTQTGGGWIFFRATADVDHTVTETDETNNVYKDSYPGQALHK